MIPACLAIPSCANPLVRTAADGATLVFRDDDQPTPSDRLAIYAEHTSELHRYYNIAVFTPSMPPNPWMTSPVTF